MDHPKKEDYGDRYNPYMHVDALVKWIEKNMQPKHPELYKCKNPECNIKQSIDVYCHFCGSDLKPVQ